MLEIINLATNIIGFADIIVFCYLSWLLVKFFQKVSRKNNDVAIYAFYIAVTFYALYRLGYAVATLPEPKQNFFEIALASNILFAIAGVSFYIAAKRLLKHSRSDINGHGS
jgi:hypothetical protein